MIQTANAEVLVNSAGSALVGKQLPIQGENPEVGAGDPETIALAYQSNSTETYDLNAFIDPTLQVDIDSIKLYTRRSAATVIAVIDGDFETATTWWNIGTGTQAVPGAGDNILIPRGVTVTYNQESTTQYGTIRVDGGWEFANDTSIELWCDTIYIDHTGTYEMARPTSDTFTQKVVFTDNGALDVTNDPVKMQRGLVCFGQANILGTAVIGYARATGDIAQGATSVTLDRQVQGVSGFRDWKVGDTLVIAPTALRGHVVPKAWHDHEHEEVTVTAIDNTTPTAPIISWFGGLTYAHDACWRRPGWTAHIINLTRNFQTWTDGEPADAQRRAHQLFKNKDQNTIEYVEAFGMGRTDMDFLTLGTEVVKLSSMPTIDSTTNTNGRYPWHFHRNGAQDPTLNPSIFRGCVARDCPSWAFVHHDSHGEMIDCIAYDVQAVGFAGEGGGTWGEINNCIAIAGRRTWKAPNTATIKTGGHDVGDIGNAFWSNSRPLKIKNCVAIGFPVGFAWTSRVSFGTSVYPGITDEVRAFWGLAAVPDTTVSKLFAPIQGFEDNESYCCNWGISVAKNLPTQHHDLVSFFDGFKCWEVQTGAHWQYTGMYSMRNFELIRYDGSKKVSGVYEKDRALWPFRQTVGMVFINPVMEKFSEGIRVTNQDGSPMFENKAHKVFNPTFVDVFKHYSRDGTEITLPWSNRTNGFVDLELVASLDAARLTAGTITPAYTEDSCTWAGGSDHFVIAWDFTYTDSMGLQHRQRSVPEEALGWGLYVNGQNEANDYARQTKNGGVMTLITSTQMQLMMVQEGVYTSAAGDKVLLIPDIIQDRSTGLTTKFLTPVALRMPTSEFNNINPPDNGALGTPPLGDNDFVEDFTSFNPAGTPGLT